MSKTAGCCLGQQEDRIVQIALSGAIWSGQHIDLTQSQVQIPDRAVSLNVDLTDGHSKDGSSLEEEEAYSMSVKGDITVSSPPL